MSNITLAPLPNPNTPLAFLDPTAAYQTSVSIYVLAGSAGVLVWDVLDNVLSDYALLFNYRISFTTVVYFVSRIGSLGYVIASNIFETAPTGHCAAFETITDSFYPLSLSASALLFFLRLRAIYNRDPIIVFLFFLLWLGLVGTTMIVPIVILGANIGPTQYCIDANVPNATYAGLITPVVHDTLIFIAITYRLVTNAHRELDLKEGLESMLFGKYLPSFSRGLLKDGQKYYLLSVLSNIITVIMAFNTSVPVPMRSMCATPNIVITNIMACRVYRNTKFGSVREAEVSTTALDLPGHRLPAFPIFARSHAKGMTTTGGTGTTALNSYDTYPLSDITTKVHADPDVHGTAISPLDSKSPEEEYNPRSFLIDVEAQRIKFP